MEDARLEWERLLLHFPRERGTVKSVQDGQTRTTWTTVLMNISRGTKEASGRLRMQKDMNLWSHRGSPQVVHAILRDVRLVCFGPLDNSVIHTSNCLSIPVRELQSGSSLWDTSHTSKCLLPYRWAHALLQGKPFMLNAPRMFTDIHSETYIQS